MITNTAVDRKFQRWAFDHQVEIDLAYQVIGHLCSFNKFLIFLKELNFGSNQLV
jgi:hypothetical protein